MQAKVWQKQMVFPGKRHKCEQAQRAALCHSSLGKLELNHETPLCIHQDGCESAHRRWQTVAAEPTCPAGGNVKSHSGYGDLMAINEQNKNPAFGFPQRDMCTHICSVFATDPRTEDVLGRLQSSLLACHSESNEQKQDLNVKNALHSEILKSEKTVDCHSKYLSYITSPDRRLIQRRVGTKTVNHSRTQAPLSPQVVSQVSKTCHVRVSLSSIRLGWLASDPQRTPCLGLPAVWNSSMTTKPSFLHGFWGLNMGSHACVAKHLMAFIDKALLEGFPWPSYPHILKDVRGPSEKSRHPLKTGAYICGTQV